MFFCLRSCCYHLPLPSVHPLRRSLSLSSLSPKFFSAESLRPSPSLSPTTMSSSRPSAFDALMSNARAAAAAAKKKPQQSNSISSSSPNKHKTLNSKTLDSKTLVSDPPMNKDPVAETEVAGSNLNNSAEETQVSDGLNNSAAESGLVAKKKPRLMTMSADESVVQLRKKAASFDPKKAALWGEGERVPFLFLCKVFDAVSNESGRIVITEIVCNMLRTVIQMMPDDLVAVVYLLANRIAPAHEGLELGIGDASIIKALAEACGGKEAHIKKQYKELGDLGLVAKANRSSQPLMRKPEPLTVAKVFNTFRVIAKESGKDSQDKKKNHIKALLVAATDCEPQYLIRLLQTKLRIGLAEQTLLTALGHAAVYSEKHSSPPPSANSPLEEAAKIVKQVYSVIPVYDKIISSLLSSGVWDLPKTCSFSPCVPVGPMLAKPTKGVSEILDKFQDMEFTCEFKYDGERAQIHYLEDGSVEIYSRNAERNTGKFPDVVIAVSREREFWRVTKLEVLII